MHTTRDWQPRLDSKKGKQAAGQDATPRKRGRKERSPRKTRRAPPAPAPLPLVPAQLPQLSTKQATRRRATRREARPTRRTVTCMPRTHTPRATARPRACARALARARTRTCTLTLTLTLTQAQAQAHRGMASVAPGGGLRPQGPIRHAHELCVPHGLTGAPDTSNTHLYLNGFGAYCLGCLARPTFLVVSAEIFENFKIVPLKLNTPPV